MQEGLSSSRILWIAIIALFVAL
jgi:competence transcription factor ComK